MSVSAKYGGTHGDAEERSIGEPVRRLQAKLGIEADGEFGPNTEKALKDWQTKNGLSADG